MKITLAKKEQTISSLLIHNNSKCNECGLTTSYANLWNYTFVCTDCSGILLSMGHRLKSVTASTFSQPELEELERRGNRGLDRNSPGFKDKFKLECYLRTKYSKGVLIAEPRKPSLFDSFKSSSDDVGVNPLQMKIFGDYSNANLQMAPESLLDDEDVVYENTSAKKSVRANDDFGEFVDAISPVVDTENDDDFDDFQSAPPTMILQPETPVELKIVNQKRELDIDPYAALRSIYGLSSSVFNSPTSPTTNQDPYAVFQNMKPDPRKTSIWDTHTSLHSSKETQHVQYHQPLTLIPPGQSSTQGNGDTTSKQNLLDDLLAPVVKNLSLH